jgi:hypothetical protein
MAPRFLFVVLSIAFGVAVILATITTVRHLNHRADSGIARHS